MATLFAADEQSEAMQSSLTLATMLPVLHTQLLCQSVAILQTHPVAVAEAHSTEDRVAEAVALGRVGSASALQTTSQLVGLAPTGESKKLAIGVPRS